MNRFIYCLMGIALLMGCKKEIIDFPEEKNLPKVIRFGSTDNDVILSRATLGDYPENRVYNIYIAAYNAAGEKVYGQFFDASNQKANSNDLATATEDCWFVQNTNNSLANTTQGYLRISIPTGNNYKIYGFSNLDADMIDVSHDKLQAASTAEEGLKHFIATLNQDVVSRNGYFPMSGVIEEVSIDAANVISDSEGKTPALNLYRMDAKVRFIFKKGTTDPNGQEIKQFIPGQWKVVNVPRKTYIMPYDKRGITATTGEDACTTKEDFFSTDWIQFEDFPKEDQSEFSFYMMENQMTPKKKATTYADRDRQIKLESGLNGDYEFANDFSTYVVITGRVEMDLKNDDAGQVLGADVQYIIHLGDFSDNKWNDFSTSRNISYTYTVTVNGVHNIRVEVETANTTNTENQPGATGNVTIAKEEIALCDAHYVSKTLTFHAKNITDDLTWYVKTPFCDGSPEIINGEDVPTGLDYEWCHFRLNERDPANHNYYKDKRRTYTPEPYHPITNKDGCMTVIDLVKYIKEQKKRFDEPLLRPDCDFDYTPEEEGGPKICVTVLVDEYYYDEHPLTHEISTTLWKRFVNQPDRLLHILCNSNISKDQESRTTGSVITIQQKSIQSIFDTRESNTSFETAWGMEHTDEYPDIWTYTANTTILGNNNVSPSENRGNSDLYNGRLNTMKEWGLANSSGTTFISGLQWNTYMDVEVANDVPTLKDKYRYLRYSCMTRNRDNNGDGKIDQDEIRWYLASIRQLVGMWIGADVVSKEGRLYNRTITQQNSSDQAEWRQHIVSSTQNKTNSNDPTVVWGEEGCSTGSIGGTVQWTTVRKWSVRCVRNLGTQNETKSTGFNLKEVPSDYVTVEKDGDNVVFTNIYLNKAVTRYYTSRELDWDNELSEQNRVYRKFETTTTNTSLGSNLTFKTLNDNITAASKNPYCPDGYRLPNQRELALMRYYLSSVSGVSGLNNKCFSRTYFSTGTHGTKRESKEGYGYNDGNIFLNSSSDNGNTIRCVRDVRTDE